MNSSEGPQRGGVELSATPAPLRGRPLLRFGFLRRSGLRSAALIVLFCTVTVARADPPPLTEDQRVRIAKLANETKQEADRLKTVLDRRQQELADVYAVYKLDEDRAEKLESEILDIQKHMLANHRKMQVELRVLVGEERFNLLRRRLDNMLKTPPKSAETPKKP
jgi:hypothetical protein